MNLFANFSWTSAHQKALDNEGHLVLPGLLTATARERMTLALQGVLRKMEASKSTTGAVDEKYRRYAAEHDAWLANLIDHPQMLALVRSILGANICFDHCVTLHREPGDPGMHWHAHPYAEARPELRFLRMFFYVNGFAANDGGLKVVPGSHHYRDGNIHASNDSELQREWLQEKTHPNSSDPLKIQHLQAPAGSVVLMWTHGLHAVSPRRATSDNRWLVVYAYRNPGEPSASRWINEEFEEKQASRLGSLLDR